MSNTTTYINTPILLNKISTCTSNELNIQFTVLNAPTAGIQTVFYRVIQISGNNAGQVLYTGYVSGNNNIAVDENNQYSCKITTLEDKNPINDNRFYLSIAVATKFLDANESNEQPPVEVLYLQADSDENQQKSRWSDYVIRNIVTANLSLNNCYLGDNAANGTNFTDIDMFQDSMLIAKSESTDDEIQYYSLKINDETIVESQSLDQKNVITYNLCNKFKELYTNNETGCSLTIAYVTKKGFRNQQTYTIVFKDKYPAYEQIHSFSPIQDPLWTREGEKITFNADLIWSDELTADECTVGKYIYNPEVQDFYEVIQQPNTLTNINLTDASYFKRTGHPKIEPIRYNFQGSALNANNEHTFNMAFQGINVPEAGNDFKITPNNGYDLSIYKITDTGEWVSLNPQRYEISFFETINIDNQWGCFAKIEVSNCSQLTVTFTDRYMYGYINLEGESYAYSLYGPISIINFDSPYSGSIEVCYEHTATSDFDENPDLSYDVYGSIAVDAKVIATSKGLGFPSFNQLNDLKNGFGIELTKTIAGAQKAWLKVKNLLSEESWDQNTCTISSDSSKLNNFTTQIQCTTKDIPSLKVNHTDHIFSELNATFLMDEGKFTSSESEYQICLFKTNLLTNQQQLLRRSSDSKNLGFQLDTCHYIYNTDILDESGVPYEYTVELTIKNPTTNQNSYKIATKQIESALEGIWLIDTHHLLQIHYDETINNLKRNVQDTVTQTLGGQYPHIRRNGLMNYRTFELGGIISYLSNSSGLIEELVEDSTNSPKELYVDAFNSSFFQFVSFDQSTLSGNDLEMLKEKEFRDRVIEFLYNDNVKLFKSPTEGNMLIRLTNISLTPKQELGRMIYAFTAQATEVAEATQENLIKYGIQIEGGDIDAI